MTIDRGRIAPEGRQALYSAPFPSRRVGPLYNCFSYPTKIDAEAVALFIATHTAPGESVLDVFGGSGTTGIAARLCDRPTERMVRTASDLGLQPQWGPRHAVVYELSSIASTLAEVMCNPPDPSDFSTAAHDVLAAVEQEYGWLYEAVAPDGEVGSIRYSIWSDVLTQPCCGYETTFWDAAVSLEPAEIGKTWRCERCGAEVDGKACDRRTAAVVDPSSGEVRTQRERRLVWVYGRSKGRTWSRAPVQDDFETLGRVQASDFRDVFPDQEIEWGDLYRRGYHEGIERFHHLYTERNLAAFSALWSEVQGAKGEIGRALRVWLLSYNASHATILTRVVAKKGQRDLVVSGAQSGVLYVPGLPVEKNVFAGVRRKIKTFTEAFEMTRGSRSRVRVVNGSSTTLDLPDESVDYAFTDPPFGGFIPYAEINQVNEAWLGKLTERQNEAIVSPAQGKSVSDYGDLVAQVFSELRRVLRKGGEATVVFHAATPDVWDALGSAFGSAGFTVARSSVLDKQQVSFKQVVHEGGTRGDALFLLSRDGQGGTASRWDSVESAIEILLTESDGDQVELEPRRLYSRYVAHCVEAGLPVEASSSDFYRSIEIRLADQLGVAQ